MSVIRWIFTIVGFPLGGLAAIQLASTTGGPLDAAIAGLVAGTVIGTAQWLALRPVVNPLWIAVSAGGLAAGAAVGVLVTSADTSASGLVIFGAIAGAAMAAAQGILLRRGLLRAGLWMLVAAVSWAIAWFITAAVIVDEQLGYVVFGLSGAAVVTVATGLTLRLLLGARTRRTDAAAVTA